MSIRMFIDFFKDLDFDDTYENVTDDLVEATWTIGMSEAYRHVSDGALLTFRLKNTDGQYSPDNDNSPIQVSLHAQIRIDETVSGETLWRGWLDIPQDIYQHDEGQAAGRSLITFNGIDGREVLLDNEVPLALYENVTGDTIINDVLSNSAEMPLAEFGGAGGTVETGIQNIALYGDLPNSTAWQHIEEVTKAEYGRAFMNRIGQLEWWNRQHLATTTDSAGTVYNFGSGDAQYQEVNLLYGRDFQNVVRVSLASRREPVSETLWQLNENYTIPHGNSKTFEATLRTDDGRFAGAGTVTANDTYSQGTCTVGLTMRGNRVTVTLTNSDPNVDAVLDSFSLEGVPQIAHDKLDFEVSDTASINQYGRRALSTIGLGASTDYEDAENIARFELQRRKDPIGVVDWIIFRRSQDDLQEMVDWGMGTRLSVVVSTDETLGTTWLRHSRDYYVIGEEWTLTRDGYVEVRKFLEPAANQDAWILGVPGFSELGETTLLGL